MSAPAPDAAGLARALAAQGFACTVEPRERLALLVPTAEWPALDDAAARRAVHALATRFGFTHVALELDGGDAPGAADAAGVAGVAHG